VPGLGDDVAASRVAHLFVIVALTAGADDPKAWRDVFYLFKEAEHSLFKPPMELG